jgi:hypothetical protein
MLIIQDKMGMQLANRLFIFGHFIANSIEHEYILVNPTFDEYCKYFPAIENNIFSDRHIYFSLKVDVPIAIFSICAKIINKIFASSQFHEFIQASATEQYNLNDPIFINKVKNKIVIANGWLFRDDENFNKHGDTIRALFAPDEKVSEKINLLFSDTQNMQSLVIGVHLRKGDYKVWQEGRYYFSNDVYIDKMEQLQTYFSSIGKKVLFLLCSNESIEENEFRNHNIKLGIGGIIEDLYSLAKCDLLIGAPSTYSGWASFYGKVPLLFITDRSQIINVEDFSIVGG